jgi:hypothetical protein
MKIKVSERRSHEENNHDVGADGGYGGIRRDYGNVHH